MKVLKLNDLSNWNYILTCRGCHSELTVDAQDLKRKDHLRHHPWVTVVYDELYAVCPNCSYATTVPDTVIPDSIWDSVVAKAKAAEPPPPKKEEKKWYHHPLAYVLFGLLAAVIMVFCFID